MSVLADLLNPPSDASGRPYAIVQRVMVVSSTDNTVATLGTAIDAWMLVQSDLTNTLFGAPVFMGSTGTGINLRYHTMIPYAFFVAP